MLILEYKAQNQKYPIFIFSLINMIQMNNSQNNPKILQLPQKCKCQYQAEISAYRCQFNVKNLSNQTVYLNITSTLLHYMQIEMFIPHITPGQTKKISAKLRPPNQIYALQFIGISYCFIQKLDFLAILSDDKEKTSIRLQFQTTINQDQQLDQILKLSSQNQIQSATTLMSKGEFKAATNTLQEAFTLYRRNLACLLLWAQAQIKLGNYLKSSRILDLIFYFPQSPEYLKAFVVKAQVILFLMNAQNFPGKLSIVKRILKLLKINYDSGLLEQQYEARSNQIVKKFQDIKRLLIQQQQGGLLEELLQKSVEQFQSNQQIRSQFQSKQEYINFLRKMKTNVLKNQNQTPQYALDPITYQIFMDPVLTPAGVSYEKQSMIQYFKKHGPKDPLMRTYLDPNTVINNITLKILVRNNPNLSKWLKFEQSASKF